MTYFLISEFDLLTLFDEVSIFDEDFDEEHKKIRKLVVFLFPPGEC